MDKQEKDGTKVVQCLFTGFSLINLGKLCKLSFAFINFEGCRDTLDHWS